MHWTGWIVVALAVLSGGWMTFDGARALTVGDYITPSSGEHAGQLGPWAQVIQTAGLNPRSTLVKGVFVVYGAMLVLLAIAFALQWSWAWGALLGVAVLGLWYIPLGTILNLVVILLLLLPPLRV